jgi:Ion channel
VRKGLLQLEERIRAAATTVDSIDDGEGEIAQRIERSKLTRSAKKLKKLQRMEAGHAGVLNPINVVFLRIGRSIRRLSSLSELQWISMVLAYVFVIFAIGIGALMHFEKWNFAEAFYFVSYAHLTIGYGDIAPKSVGGVWFTTLWLPTNISFVSLYMGSLSR